MQYIDQGALLGIERHISCRIILLFVLLVLPAGCDLLPKDHSEHLLWAIGIVIKIIDGDTFEVRYKASSEGLPTRIRPYLIDTPERGKCFFKEAADGAARFLLGRTVWLQHQSRLTFNRLLVFIYLDSSRQTLFQAVMVSQGLARVDVRHPEERPFETWMNALQSGAQAARRGQWGVCFEYR